MEQPEDQLPVVVCLASGIEEQWLLSFRSAARLDLEISAPDGRTWHASGTDLFTALQSARRELEGEGIRLCCNGARVNARPSSRASESGGWVLYLIRRHRPATLADLVFTLDYAPPTAVATVAAQEKFWARANANNFLNLVKLLSPIWWFYKLRGHRFKPRLWRAPLTSGENQR